MSEREELAGVREGLIEAVSVRLHVTTDRITGLAHGIALSADTSAVEEAVDAVLASDTLARMLAEARAEALREAYRELIGQASLRFGSHGPHDARGAALWDAGCWLNPDDHDALAAALAEREAGQ